ncbi:uncharacterized protein LOC122304700 [Carya illinoinensis]|uniref:uncharacterized protein LOC122304700 n=1 Tax=Carya illinoinensis TaxID=32201 RepID=UPI001C71EB22|nr:uncharacterized protein LOC122304700 [Carya illinoinensis]
MLDQKRERLRRLQDSDTGQNCGLIKTIQKEIDELLEEEELKWRQRAKQRWLKDGDRNTKYFHRCATHRKQMNTIKVITSEEGVREHSQEENIDEALQSVQPCVSEEMNLWITRAFTEEEVTAAIKGMNPLGSPGPDGFPTVFYQHHWGTVGKSATKAILEALNGSWVNLVMECVTTVSYSLLVNGVPQKIFYPTRVTGQRLNIEKTSIFYNRNTRKEVQQAILQQAGLRAHGPFDKYLGLPSYVGRQKTKAFTSIVDRIKSKMASWKTKVLSQGGKEILLKSVLQSIPTYSMGIFKLPKSIIRILNRLLQSFWWGQTDSKSKVHWLSWQTMGKPKDQGGMGFRDFEFFNLALLAKQGWRIIQDPTSLAAQVLKAKYFSGSNFFSQKIKIWQDKWLLSLSTFNVQSPVRILNAEAKVAELIDPDTGQWNLNLIYAIFSEPEAKIISRMTISQCDSQDMRTWRCLENGKFTVRSAYHLQGTMEGDRKGQCSSLNHNPKTWRKMWSLQAPQATKSFLWRAAKESLPMCVNLFKRKMVDSPLCPVCHRVPESVTHAIWSCSAAQDVWSMSAGRIQKLNVEGGPFLEVLKQYKSREECWSPTGLMVRDIKLVLSRIFKNTQELHSISLDFSLRGRNALKTQENAWRGVVEKWRSEGGEEERQEWLLSDHAWVDKERGKMGDASTK